MYQTQLEANGVEIPQEAYNVRRVLCDDGTTWRGICRFAGHNSKTCDYYESWFDWDNPAHDAFQEVFRQSLRRRWPLGRPMDDFSTWRTSATFITKWA